MSMLNLFEIDDLIREAVIDPTAAYRYRLSRIWGDDVRRLCNFIMLNPSTADAIEDDPTIRRCVGFAKAWGYGGIVATNLFAFRATDPARMSAAADPRGPENDSYVFTTAAAAALVVCAWGTHGKLLGRGMEVKAGLLGRGITPHHLGLTRGGHPRHPLYLAGSNRPVAWADGAERPGGGR